MIKQNEYINDAFWLIWRSFRNNTYSIKIALIIINKYEGKIYTKGRFKCKVVLSDS